MQGGNIALKHYVSSAPATTPTASHSLDSTMDKISFDNLPPEILKLIQNTGVAPPPNGTTSNFVDPQTRAALQMWTTSVCGFVALVFYLNRVYVKMRLMKNWAWDERMSTFACSQPYLGLTGDSDIIHRRNVECWTIYRHIIWYGHSPTYPYRIY